MSSKNDKRSLKTTITLIILALVCLSIIFSYKYIKGTEAISQGQALQNVTSSSSSSTGSESDQALGSASAGGMANSTGQMEFLYKVTSVNNGEESELGTYSLKDKFIFISEDNPDVYNLEITETEIFNTNVSSEDKKDEVKNEKVYLVDEDFNLLSLTEKEYINGKLSLDRLFEISNLKDSELNEDLIEITTYIDGEKQEPILLPKDSISVSLASYGILTSLNFSPSRELNNVKFFKNIDRYIEKSYPMDKVVIKNDLLGDVECSLIEYTSYSKDLLWVDYVYGTLIKREKEYNENFKLIYELISIN